MAIVSTPVWMLFVSLLVSQTTPVFANISLLILILLIKSNKNYNFCIHYSCLHQYTINGECFLWLLGFFMYSRIIYLVIGKAHLSYNGAKCSNYIPLLIRLVYYAMMDPLTVMYAVMFWVFRPKVSNPALQFICVAHNWTW